MNKATSNVQSILQSDLAFPLLTRQKRWLVKSMKNAITQV